MIYVNVSEFNINLGSLKKQIQRGQEFDTSIYGKEDLDKCTDLKRAIVSLKLIPKEPEAKPVENKVEMKKPKSITRVTTTDNKAVVVETEKEVSSQSVDQEIATESGTIGAKVVKSDLGEKAVIMEQKQPMPDINKYGAKPVANIEMDKGSVVMTAPKDIEEFEKDLQKSSVIEPEESIVKVAKDPLLDFDKMNFQDVKEVGKKYGLKVNGVSKDTLINNIKTKLGM